jgi:hypothetical protein
LSTPISIFVARSEAFCAIVEDSSDVSSPAFTRAIHLCVAALYAAGLELPSPLEDDGGDDDDAADDEAISSPSSIEPDPDRLSHDEWRRVYDSIGSRLAGADMYMEMFDPFGWTEEPVVGSLADDLADVYQEIRAGLLKWRRGERDDAVWTWRFGLETHWAEHATGAMRALQALIFRYEFEPPRPSDERPNER